MRRRNREGERGKDPGRALRSSRSERAPRRAGPLVVLLWLAVLLAASHGWSALDSFSWRPIPTPTGRGVSADVLAQSAAGDIALGDAAGVSWLRAGEWARAALPGVHDLAFDGQGILWIATALGLHRWDAADRPTHRSLLRGGGSALIRRIASDSGAIVIASSAGAYWSADGRILQPLAGGSIGTARPVELVALRRWLANGGSPRAEVWIQGEGRLTRIRGIEAASGLRVIEARDAPLPSLPRLDQTPVDLAIDPGQRWLHLVFGDRIARRALAEGAGSEADELDVRAWQVVSPVLPPGAVIRRVGWAAGRIWLATDHGLLEGGDLAGPFVRASSPVGTSPCAEVEPSRRFGVLAVCRSGLFATAGDPVQALAAGEMGSPDGGEMRAVSGAQARWRETMETTQTGAARGSPERMLPDPPLAEIRRRALDRSGLAVERSRKLWRGLSRRGLLPEVGLRFAADVDRDESRDRDQSYVSGATRRLSDRSRDENDRFAVAIEFDWDFRDLLYPSDSVDLSRELRQVVSLRDDVADEINQAYFERQRIRERLQTAPPVEREEAQRLRWRARELDAGLDAWTGGWIARWRADGAASLIDAPGPSFHPDREHTKVKRR